MRYMKMFNSRALLWAAFSCATMTTSSAQQPSLVTLDPSHMSKLGTVDPRYVSYNIEMVEVTGGRFWKPYKSIVAAKPETASNSQQDMNQQVGDSTSLFQYRPPIDLSNPRLRKLAEALGPAYVRVSGTWANSTYFQDNNGVVLKAPPKGFRGVLTRAEWKGVVDFAQAVNAKIVTSVAVSAGTRNAEGTWTPNQATALFGYTKKLGSNIAAAEFMNEPSFPSLGGAPPGYDAKAFAKDAKLFQMFLRNESPQTIFLGPGGTGEGVSLAPAVRKMTLLRADDILSATGPIFDVFSYHFYGAVSRRCMGGTTAPDALKSEWLDRTDVAEKFYADMRDRFMPGKPMWLTETGEAACGGDQLASEFVDMFRYLNQLGALAQKGVRVIIHNTLASSDYGLLDEDTLQPRPDYWAALLWKRTMGPIVLDPGRIENHHLRIYAQCLRGSKGGVSLLALNTSTTDRQTIAISATGKRYTLMASRLTSLNVLLNGTELRAAPDGSLPRIQGQHISTRTLHLEPLSITFLTIPAAKNEICMQ